MISFIIILLELYIEVRAKANRNVCIERLGG